MRAATRVRAFGGPVTLPGLTRFQVSAAPDGAWTFFGGPRSVHENGWTYIGYVDTSGNVCLRTYEHATQTVGAEIILKATLDIDDHVNPSLFVRPDGKLQAFYCQHEPLSTTMFTRVSTATLASDPDLSSGFGSETSLDAQLGSFSYDYPQPIYLEDEATVYLFWRNIPSGNSYRLCFSTSTDGGDTWSAMTTLYQNVVKTNRAYWQIISNDFDRIDFAVTDGSPNTDTTHLAHFYYDGTWRQSDGTDMGAPTFNFNDFTAVYTAANTWVWDIAYDSGDNPRILHPTFPTPFTDHRYNESRWNGSAWSFAEITTGGAGIDATGVYSGGMAYDHADPTDVWTSRQVSGQWEIYRHTRTGETWASEVVTSGSSAKNVRPYVPKDSAIGLLVYWMYGSYTSYTNFNTGIVGAR